ncbi:MAG TPA: CoA transferase [Dehalococcoidales bacterium]|nr:CoA transferase [Dehalococcoidales bacterium]
MHPDSSSPVLKDLRILDFGWVLAGPFATRLLGDYGAEVIKIQPLLPQAADSYSRAYYRTWNRNKLGIGLDLSKTEGLDIARRLVKISDVVVENFSPRVFENWGLDYPRLKELKPDIILLSLSLMGHSGPWRDFAGFGPGAQAAAGMTYITAYADNAPVGLGYAFADHMAGLYGALAVLGALEYRDRTGKGQFIDLSQTETLLSLLAEPFYQYFFTGKTPEAQGNRSEKAAPQGVYACRGEDQWCAITVASDAEWQRFKAVMGFPAWAEDIRYHNVSGRLSRQDELDIRIGEWTALHTAEEIAAGLQTAGIAAEPVKNTAELSGDAHLQARGFFQHGESGVEPPDVMDRSPIRLSDTPAGYHNPAPETGRDNLYILKDLLGMSDSDVSHLMANKVIA